MVNARHSTPLNPLKIALVVLSLVSASAALGAGCGGKITGGGSSSSGGDGGAGGGGDGGGAVVDKECFDYSTFKGSTPEVAFTADVLPILRRSCGVSTSCHGTQTPPSPPQHYLGPALDKADPTPAEVEELVAGLNVSSEEEPGMKVVEAGNPAQSYIMYKMDSVKCSRLSCYDDDTCGVLMPLGNSKPMAATDRDVIRRWIAQGAKAN